LKKNEKKKEKVFEKRSGKKKFIMIAEKAISMICKNTTK